jgi:hypothetical protein
MKQLTAEQIFGEALLHRALKMHKIDQRTGQQNDTSYMAYLLEHVVGTHNGGGS